MDKYEYKFREYTDEPLLCYESFVEYSEIEDDTGNIKPIIVIGQTDILGDNVYTGHDLEALQELRYQLEVAEEVLLKMMGEVDEDE